MLAPSERSFHLAASLEHLSLAFISILGAAYINPGGFCYTKATRIYAASIAS